LAVLAIVASASACLGAHASARPPALVVEAGAFDIDDELDPMVGVELRMPEHDLGLVPIAGVAALGAGGLYAYGGLRYPIELSERWTLAPSFAGGLYEEGKVDPGGAIEFRSVLELSFLVRPGLRAGVYVGHLSNSSIYAHNPGTEVVVLNLAVDAAGIWQRVFGD
jgi:hypothetical protein